MRRVYHIALSIIACMLCSCATDTLDLNNKLFDEGVSLELAQLRKSTIHNIRYNLHFTIPQERDSSVTGKVDICFHLDKSQNIVIDFRAEREKINSVAINGTPTDYTLHNEHLIFSDRLFAVGDNVISIGFTAPDISLNRNDEYLYTLLVPDRARTLFPCFEQPDLKAEFRLGLTIPEQWQAVSNTSVSKQHITAGRKHIEFNPTEPLSTYLFSFVAGKLYAQSYDDGRHTFTAYYRETDPKRIAQLDTIFKQVAASVDWLEEFTGVEYPFAKYDFIILPGFQYGGMEHTGATLYNDTQLFLSEHPTPDEELRRIQLIAHETAHMWFGDYVTMAWFDDVWTKEVFANYFAARIAEPLFPEINHTLSMMKTIVTASLSEDRTDGSTAIKQPLDNLSNAGLIYGNIIYNKAPVMMHKMVEMMGEDAFKDGIREYLHSYAYGNATWDQLIDILDEHSEYDLATFSDVWVNQPSMPHIEFVRDGNTLTITQHDPLKRGLCWDQRFNISLIGDSTSSIEVDMTTQSVTINIPDDTRYILPNSDGRGYGHFIVEESDRRWILDNLHTITDETTRQSLLMTIYENYQNGVIDDRALLETLLRTLRSERNALIASTICSYLHEPMTMLRDSATEQELLTLTEIHPITSCRQQLLRLLMSVATSRSVTDALYKIWESGNHQLLNESDYMKLSYELSLRYPERYSDIITTQRARISNPDRQRQFDFISRAVSPDETALDTLFDSLLDVENRTTEPWVATTLSYLNHPLRSERAVRYIRPALDELHEIQRTGDIFFPSNWTIALFSGHRSVEAYNELNDFLNDNSNYPQLLKNKILQAAWALTRINKLANDSESTISLQ